MIREIKNTISPLSLNHLPPIILFTYMSEDFINKLYQSHKACPTCPSPAEVSEFYIHLLGALFPDFSSESFTDLMSFEAYLQTLQKKLEEMLSHTPGHTANSAKEIASRLFNSLSKIHSQLEQDIVAMYSGDPAAKSTNEVVRTYPGFYAIAAYRIANTLHSLGSIGIPRVITEHAHSKTGIDIHPAAKIGDHFCIDHGTGVVIGETTIIGSHVKIYQGVTLGALSVDKNDAEKKRHPTIEDNVVIYAGATILGGATEIGRDSVIGGNVWLTRSIPPHSKIYYQAKMHTEEDTESDLIYIK